VDRGVDSAVVAAGTILEAALPLVNLQVAQGASASFFILVLDRAGREIERQPGHRPVEARIPDRRFEAKHWTV
jgi:hypothetical protein